MWFQIILVVAIVLIGVLVSRSVPSDTHLALRRLGVFALIVAGVVMILVPEWLTAIANAFGIGRGADLLLYGLVLAFMGYVATDYRRSVKANQQMTRLARELALAEARSEYGRTDDDRP